MRTSTQIVTGIFLAASALISIPLSAATYDAYDAYEELSGTHAGKTQLAAEGMRGREGSQGEAGMAGSKPAAAIPYDAYEDLSGTHATFPTVMAGLRGPSGRAGESGESGKVNGNWTRFNVGGDAADGCSKYLRCSNE